MNLSNLHGKSKRKQSARMGRKLDKWFIIVSSHYHFTADNIQTFWLRVNDSLNQHITPSLSNFHVIAKTVKDDDKRIVSP